MNSAVENSPLIAKAEAPGASQGRRGVALWGGTIFLSAFLLFQVQPLLTKVILPWFGGGAGVWLAALVFFQITYLLGNLYAYWLIHHPSSRWSTKIHVGLLALSFLSLPILPGVTWKPYGPENPSLRIFALL